MIVRPGASDLRIIGFYLGKVVLGLGIVMAAPTILAAALREWNSLTALVIGAAVCLGTGALTEAHLHTREPLAWAHSTVIVALAWLIGSLLVAIPFYLSGHFATYGDAAFEAMSGLTTTGLTVLQDLDHLSRSMNLFRHLTHFAGGQGIIIVVLSLFAAGGARIGSLYVSEGRDERILPSFIRTARFIFLVAGVYLLIGTAALTIAMIHAGVPPHLAVYDALLLFMATFDTGGFAGHSASLGYYHSLPVELVSVVLMLAGSLSFGLHFQLWRGDPRVLARNIETQVLGLSIVAFSAIAMIGLARSGAITDATGLFRKAFVTIVSAQSSTGLTVVPGRMFVTDWGPLAPAAVVAAGALGGMASSTAGGIKMIRVGIAFKSLMRDVRRVLLPESALVVETYHTDRRRILRDDQIRAATTILLLFAVTYLGGAVVGLAYGRWDVTETIFESVMAAANGGMSVGIVAPGMPRVLELTYFVQMWLGRLEFMAVIATVGYAVALVRGRT